MAEMQEEIGFDVEAHLFSSAVLPIPEPASFAGYVVRHGFRIWEEGAPLD